LAILFWEANANDFGGDEDEEKVDGINDGGMLMDEVTLPGLGPPAIASLFLTT
jgi:hypothetical protein